METVWSHSFCKFVAQDADRFLWIASSPMAAWSFIGNLKKKKYFFQFLCNFFETFFKGNAEQDFWGDSPIFELERWNFQQMLDLGFPETLQSLSSFKQLLFSLLHRGDQRKKNKKPVNPLKNLALHFLIGIPFLKLFEIFWRFFGDFLKNLIFYENY